MSQNWVAKNEHGGPTRVSTLSYHLLSFTRTKVSSRNSLQKEVSAAGYLTKLIIDSLYALLKITSKHRLKPIEPHHTFLILLIEMAT